MAIGLFDVGHEASVRLQQNWKQSGSFSDKRKPGNWAVTALKVRDVNLTEQAVSDVTAMQDTEGKNTASKNTSS